MSLIHSFTSDPQTREMDAMQSRMFFLGLGEATVVT